jgi:hypothetical protein
MKKKQKERREGRISRHVKITKDEIEWAQRLLVG